MRVPAENRIGEENKGWTYAKFLLGHERTGIAGVSKSKQKVKKLKTIAGIERAEGGSLLDDHAFKSRISKVEVSLSALEITNLRMMSSLAGGGHPGPESSTLKISGTTIEQELNELLVEALGYYALPYGPSEVRSDVNEPPVGPAHSVGLMGERLLRRAAYYAGQYGAGVLLAPVLPYAIPIALGVGFLAEQDYGNDMVQQVADLGAMPGTLAASALDIFSK